MPVEYLQSIRILPTALDLHNWHTVHLYIVFEFNQPPVEKDLYMVTPNGFDKSKGNIKDYDLNIHHNIYGHKQAGRVWNQHLFEKIVREIMFVQSKHNECVLCQGTTIYALYTDDLILSEPENFEIYHIFKDMEETNLDFTIEGDLQDFIGVNTERKANGTNHLN